MNPGRPSMQQIADVAGVSKSAVSLALKNDPRLPSETRERIQRVATEMGYQRNPVMANLMAQLRASRTPKFQANIAWVNLNGSLEKNGNHVYLNFQEGAKSRAEQMGYNLEEIHVDAVQDLKPILESKNVRGLIIPACVASELVDANTEALPIRISCTLVGAQHNGTQLPTAMVDFYQTAKLATNKIIQLGYQKPAIALGNELDTLADYRYSAGFHAALKSHGRDTIPVHYDFKDDNPDHFLSWLRQQEPDVILTTHCKILDWLTDAGMRVPEDIGLVHLDRSDKNQSWAGMLQHYPQVGSNAVDILVAQIARAETGPFPHRKIMLTESTWIPGTTVTQQS